jgi:copper chaperone CopZ
MKCNGCVATIDKTLAGLAGVHRAEVDLPTKTAEVETDTPLSAVVDALRIAGFDAMETTAG